jgi:hypothetical protein
MYDTTHILRQKRLGLGKGSEQDEGSDPDADQQSMDDGLSMDSVQSMDEQSVDDEDDEQSVDDDESADDTLPGNHVEKLEQDAEKARAHMREISTHS